MGKFENFIIQVIKAKFEKENCYFLFTLDISNLEITLSAEEQKKVKMLLHSVVIIK